MWVVRQRKSILGNLIALVLLSILAGIAGGALVGLATQGKPAGSSAHLVS
jgi:hypothetical protein